MDCTTTQRKELEAMKYVYPDSPHIHNFELACLVSTTTMNKKLNLGTELPDPADHHS